jgi:glutamate-1-semialdehyde 2,1-aminomutase
LEVSPALFFIILMAQDLYVEGKALKTIEEEYLAKHRRSSELYEEAKGFFPSGVTHDSRYVSPFPVYMSFGRGPRKWDVDENEYLCYVMGHGALILGHSHPAIVSAVKEQIEKGTHLGSSTELELKWARAVRSLVPSVEKIRFHSSGTEATLMAFRLARAFTGRSKILMFSDHFHGWHDCAVQEEGKWSSAGVPPQFFASTLKMPAGDITAVENALRNDTDIAGAILEPTGASMGCYPVRPEFVLELRRLTERHGALLLFDEVVTGFRVGPGGAQQKLGVKPDITAFAKILAGGLPGGAVGGRAEVIDMLSFHDDPAWDMGRRVSHPGTFNANPLSAAAGARCLETIAAEPVNSRADAAAERLKNSLNAVLRKGRVTGVAYGSASLVWVLFGVDNDGADPYTLPHPAVREALSSPTAKTFKRAMINEGVDIMGTGEFIVSAVHTEADIDATADAFERALAKMKKVGVLGQRTGSSRSGG